MADAHVSVIVVNWNHGRFLPDCLAALAVQPLSFEVIIVDNGSTDNSLQWVAGHYPDVSLLCFAENLGFSRAFNLAVCHSQTPFVLSLNPDVTVQPGFLAEMVRAINRDPYNGMAAPKLLRANDPARLDSTGLFIDRRRRPYDRGQGQVDEGQYDALPFTFGACGAAALYRRTMLEDIAPDGEYMDESFFAYYEDADLAWRAQLRGWHCAYAPRAVAAHVRGWGDALRKRGHAREQTSSRRGLSRAGKGRGPRLALRNRYLMTLKNDVRRHLLADWHLILAAELPRLAYAALTAPSVLLGLVDLLRAWPSAMRKRRQIQSRRTVGDAVLRRWFVAPGGQGVSESAGQGCESR